MKTIGIFILAALYFKHLHSRYTDSKQFPVRVVSCPCKKLAVARPLDELWCLFAVARNRGLCL